ncbi:MAG: pantoate--beta-alanine ligase [Gemmatimonadota bacterium]
MAVARSRGEVADARHALREAGGSLALVPTMGALHEGHLSLVDRAAELAEHVCLSVFVNPTQFGPSEDFDRYPRDLDRDLELAAARGVDLVFVPGAEDVYPREQAIWVDPGEPGTRLCGASRPGHFRGVLTVVLKLIGLVRPDVAVFGRKDFQQAVLIRRMAEDLCLGVRIEIAPTVREPDGLALSSRNAYLRGDERRSALGLSQALRRARTAFDDGERDAGRIVELARRVLDEAGVSIEYVEIVDPVTLAPVGRAASDSVCALAGRVGKTRLIDNATLGEGDAP